MKALSVRIWRGGAQGAFQAEEVGRYFQYERHLARLAVETDARLLELRALEEKRRAELEEALKSRRMVEKLQEREHAAHRAAVEADVPRRLMPRFRQARVR